jgi:dTDP-4-dehydrorhamnose reductase
LNSFFYQRRICPFIILKWPGITLILTRPQYLINCAAYTAVDRAEQEKDLAFHVNSEAVGVLAAVCKAHQTKFIHISTDYVFDGTASIPYKEDSPDLIRNLSMVPVN